MMANLVLNTSDFKKGTTKRGGPKWMFTTSVILQRKGRPPTVLASIHGCQIGAKRKVHTPGGGSEKIGYWKTVEFCQPWLDALEEQLTQDATVMEWLDTAPEGSEKPKDPAVVAISHNVAVNEVDDE